MSKEIMRLKRQLEMTQKALSQAAWFIENVTDDTPDRTDQFFKTREMLREALQGGKIVETGASYDDMIVTLQDIKEWFNTGMINDVHYDQESIVTQIEITLGNSEGRK